jgi:pilus assembly protein CpaC
MNMKSKIKTGFASAALAVAITTAASVVVLSPAHAQKVGEKQLTLSIGEVHQLNLGSAVTDVVVADPRVADVEVTSNKRVYVLGKGAGMTDLVATDAAGRTVYRARVLVGGNLSSLDQLLKLAMPDADSRNVGICIFGYAKSWQRSQYHGHKSHQIRNAATDKPPGSCG